LDKRTPQLPDRAAGYKPAAPRSLTHQALHASAAKHNSALYQSNAQLRNATLHFTSTASTARNCEPTPGSLISTCCCCCCRCRPAGHFRAARTLQIIDAGISPAPGSARPLSPIPPASRPLGAHAVSPPKFPPRPFPPFPLSERSQPASLWRRAPSLPPSLQAKAKSPPGRPLNRKVYQLSTLHGQSTSHPTPKLGNPRPGRRPGDPPRSTRLLLDAFPHPSFEGRPELPPGVPCTFSSRRSLRSSSNNNILGLLAPFTFVVTNRSTTLSVFRYRHFTIRLPSVVESRSILSTRLAVRRSFSASAPRLPC
jgi:hypothetical protein